MAVSVRVRVHIVIRYWCFQILVFLPFLVFEVLEGQVYNFLDESIQKRMKGDLNREKMSLFYHYWFGLWSLICIYYNTIKSI